MSKGDIQLKRAYDEAADNDGRRVLVDGMWPRGVSKEKAALDEWLKPIAPSKDLLKWFGHDPDRWEQFQRRYEEELRGGEQKACLDQLRAYHDNGQVTLIFGARDRRHNNAVVLKQLLQNQ